MEIKGGLIMALIADLNLDNGLVINNAYFRIEIFSGTEENVSFILNAYVNQDAFEEKRPPVAEFSYRMEFDKSRNLFSQMYEYLMGLPEFESAVEA